MEASVLTAVIAAAAFVCRAAVLEWRDPGAGRRVWAFARDRRALGAGLAATVLLGAVAWSRAGAGAVVWAALAGVLVASLTAGRRPSGDRHGRPGSRPS
ncbi:hypothetical protein [Streptomyces sp. NPDC053755]|uniref:hypothetical protein n=1 Tax=Streptomyces sp. NPDC053755 TaxID=3155815 RepID=UPI00341A76A0